MYQQNSYSVTDKDTIPAIHFVFAFSTSSNTSLDLAITAFTFQNQKKFQCKASIQLVFSINKPSRNDLPIFHFSPCPYNTQLLISIVVHHESSEPLVDLEIH